MVGLEMYKVIYDENISYIGGVIMGSEMMRDMVLFNDPVYPFIAVLGVFFSIFSLIHELIKRNEKRFIKWINGMILAILSGLLVTPIAFLILHSIGSHHLTKIYPNIDTSILNSLWWILSLLIATYSIKILKMISKALNFWGRRWN